MLHGMTVGTVRSVPLGQGLAPCEPWIGDALDEEEARGGAWEVGRFVILPEFRAGPDVMRRCLFVSLAHLIQDVAVTTLVASCTPIMSRLYRRVGLHAFATVSSLAPYVLVKGDAEQVLRGLAMTDEEHTGAEYALAHRPARLREIA